MLTVGYVAGIIALGITFISFLLPSLYALVLVALTGRQRNAATWSVVGRDVQRSLWPLMLSSDTTSSSLAPRSVQILSWTKAIGVILTALAAFITPLGLHSVIALSSRPIDTVFVHVEDSGPFGRLAPARDPDAFYSRICTDNLNFASCPFSNTIVTQENPGLNSTASWPGTYDIRIPDTTVTMFTSHHDDYPRSVAGIFDLQWRHYSYSASSDFNNGDRFVVGSYSAMDTLLADDTIQAIDGLIVDTHQGGIALRNHTAPQGLEHGAEWEEDLLYISPETACVDTNLTFEFQIAPRTTWSPLDQERLAQNFSTFVNLSIVDRGGFANLQHKHPGKKLRNHFMDYDGQTNAELYTRAHYLAWLNNYYTMAYLNVTNLERNATVLFKYMNSYVGKRFPLDAMMSMHAGFNVVSLSQDYGSYLDAAYLPGTEPLSSSPGFRGNYRDPRINYTNPFNITKSDLQLLKIDCQGHTIADRVNVSAIGVNCGLMFAAPSRINKSDGSASSFSEPGSWWSQSLYSCATGLKAEIKRTRFQWNTTLQARGLNQALTVLRTSEIVHDSPENMPHWAIERLTSTYADTVPLWGPVSKAMVGKHNDSFGFFQASRFWLPGDSLAMLPAFISNENMPAVAFFQALGETYNPISLGASRYSGSTSASIMARWRDLGSSADTAAQIPGLIWTDIIANAVTTTRSALSSERMPRNTQSTPQTRAADQATPTADSSKITFAVYVYENQITYDWLFGIPIFLVILLVGGIFVAGAVLAVMGQLPSPATMSYFINHTSAGRLLALLAYGAAPNQTSTEGMPPHESGQKQPSASARESLNAAHDISASSLIVSSREWRETVGQRMINLDDIGAGETGRDSGETRYDPGANQTADQGRYEAVSPAP